MHKKILVLGLILAGLFTAGSVWAATGANDVNVTSCEQLSYGVRLSRNGGEKYILANGCRNAGYGMRNYTLTCKSATQYHVYWNEDCQKTDTVLPKVSINSYTQADGSVNVYSFATDNIGVKRAEIYRDEILVKNCDNGDYCNYFISAADQRLSAGNHTFHAHAYDAAGNIGQSKSIVVNFKASDNSGPQVGITSDRFTYYSDENYTVRATASDNSGVDTIKIYRDGSLVSTCYSGNCSYTASAQNYNYAHSVRYYAIASDNSGNTGRSGEMTITVRPRSGSDTTRPTVRAYADRDWYYSDEYFYLKADASDNVEVVRVEIIDNNSRILKACYNTTFCQYYLSPVNNGNGAYLFKARAYDAAGNYADSSYVIISILQRNSNKSPDIYWANEYVKNQYGTDYLILESGARDSDGIAKLEIYWGSASNSLNLAKRCTFGSGKVDVSCSLEFPLMIARRGYFQVRAADQSGNTSESTVQQYYH